MNNNIKNDVVAMITTKETMFKSVETWEDFVFTFKRLHERITKDVGGYTTYDKYIYDLIYQEGTDTVFDIFTDPRMGKFMFKNRTRYSIQTIIIALSLGIIIGVKFLGGLIHG